MSMSMKMSMSMSNLDHSEQRLRLRLRLRARAGARIGPIRRVVHNLSEVLSGVAEGPDRRWHQGR